MKTNLHWSNQGIQYQYEPAVCLVALHNVFCWGETEPQHPGPHLHRRDPLQLLPRRPGSKVSQAKKWGARTKRGCKSDSPCRWQTLVATVSPVSCVWLTSRLPLYLWFQVSTTRDRAKDKDDNTRLGRLLRSTSGLSLLRDGLELLVCSHPGEPHFRPKSGIVPWYKEPIISENSTARYKDDHTRLGRRQHQARKTRSWPWPAWLPWPCRTTGKRTATSSLTSSWRSCSGLELGTTCKAWQLGTISKAWQVGKTCKVWQLGKTCMVWQFGTICKVWQLGTICKFWQLGKTGKVWQFRKTFKVWQLGTICKAWQLGKSCKVWQLGKTFKFWQLGKPCTYATICKVWQLGTICKVWQFGTICKV